MCGWPGIKILGLSNLSAENPELRFSLLKPGVCQNIARHASSTVRNSAFQFHTAFFFLPPNPQMLSDMWCELWTRLVIPWLASFALSQLLWLTGHYKCQDFLFLFWLGEFGQKMHNNATYFLHLLKFESRESGDFACMCHYFTHIYSGK